MGLAHISRIYINACGYLPKPRKNGELVVNIQQLMRNFGSASGIIMELKRIFNHDSGIQYGWYYFLKTMDSILSKTFSGRKRSNLLF